MTAKQKKKIRIRIPWDNVKELVGSLLEKGVERGDIPRIVGDGLDQLIDFDALLEQGPVGDVLEMIDGPVFAAAARLILSVIPDRKLIAYAQECQGRSPRAG